MAEARDVEALKRRGRRRLVGAIALVLAAVIVLPMVFDSAPKQAPPPVSVRIPSEDDAGFKPKVTPTVPAQPPVAAKPAAPAPAPVVPEKAEPKAEEAAPAKAVAAEPAKPIAKPPAKAEEPKAAPKPAPAAAEKARAQSALAGEQYYVQVGAFTEPSGVFERLKAAKIPYYTEPVATKTGKVVRVRAGPFASREAAQKILDQLKGLGFKPADVAVKA
jgi:DedD protein